MINLKVIFDMAKAKYQGKAVLKMFLKRNMNAIAKVFAFFNKEEVPVFNSAEIDQIIEMVLD